MCKQFLERDNFYLFIGFHNFNKMQNFSPNTTVLRTSEDANKTKKPRHR